MVSFDAAADFQAAAAPFGGRRGRGGDGGAGAPPAPLQHGGL